MNTILIILIIALIISILIAYFYSRHLRHLRQYPLRLVHYALYDYMKDFHEICEKNHLVYWADGGTLLGAVREHGIIPHDDDIDICMFEDDVKKLIEIVNTNINNKYHIYLLDHQPIYKFEHRDVPGIFLDIFVVDRDQNNQKKILYKEPKNQKVWPAFYYYEDELYPLQKMSFGAIQVNIPKAPIPYLERGYGKNWQTPIDYGRHN